MSHDFWLSSENCKHISKEFMECKSSSSSWLESENFSSLTFRFCNKGRGEGGKSASFWEKMGSWLIYLLSPQKPIFKRRWKSHYCYLLNLQNIKGGLRNFLLPIFKWPSQINQERLRDYLMNKFRCARNKPWIWNKSYL